MTAHVFECIVEVHTGQDTHGNGQSSGPAHTRRTMSDNDLAASHS